MAIDIRHQEFKVLSSHYCIRTRVDRDKLTEQMLLNSVGRMNLTPGDKFTVQCMDHAYETMFHQAEYVVTQRVEAMVTKTVEFQPMQTTVVNYSIEQIGGWWASAESSQEVAVKATGLSRKWSNGRREHVITDADGNEVFATKDKDLAIDIAEGRTPVPEAVAA